MPSQARDPSFSCSRRRLVPALLRETVVTLGMLRGGRGGRLADLRSLPDSELARMRPVVNPAYEILVAEDRATASAAREDAVCARHRQSGAVLRLFSTADTADLSAFNRFDGQHRLGEIGVLLAQDTGWEEERAFVCARDLFLSLVGLSVCIPRDPPLDREAEG